MAIKVKLFYASFVLILFVFLSCKSKISNNEKKMISIKTTNKEQNNIKAQLKDTIYKDTALYNFFDEKYSRQYSLNIDGSNFSEHPFYSYLDCKKEGYFAIHYIPKRKDMIEFWKKKYFKKYKYEYDNLEKEDSIIKKILKDSDYNIFCYRIKKDGLSKDNGCTIEAVYPKEKAKGLVYFYNQSKKEWNIIDTIDVKVLPPYLKNDFFIENYNDFFK